MSIERTLIASAIVKNIKNINVTWDEADKLAGWILNDLYVHDMFVVTLRPNTVHTYTRPKENR